MEIAVKTGHGNRFAAGADNHLVRIRKSVMQHRVPWPALHAAKQTAPYDAHPMSCLVHMKSLDRGWVGSHGTV